MNEIEKTENKLTPELQKSTGKKPTRIKLPKSIKGSKKLVLILMGILNLFFAFDIFRAGTSALLDSYQDTYNKEKDSAYEAQYNKYYEQAEKENHVSNRVAISLDKIKETANLEVLKVNDTEYVISENEDNG